MDAGAAPDTGAPAPVSGSSLFDETSGTPGSALFGQAPAAPVSGAQLFGGGTAPENPSAPVSGGALFQMPGSLKEAGQDLGLSSGTAQTISDTLTKGGSMVAKLTRPLMVPLNIESAAMVKAGKILGIPGAAELDQKMNPSGSWLPNSYASDITDFAIDKAADKMGIPQMQGTMGDQMRTLVAGTKFGIGMGANILMDPLSAVAFGQLTKEAEGIQKAGGTLENAEQVAQGAAPKVNPVGLNSDAAQTKNLINIRPPLTGIDIPIQGKPVQDLLSRVKGSSPVQGLAKLVQTLSPDTGVPELDSAGLSYDNARRGNMPYLRGIYLEPKAALNLTSDENRLAASLVEATPNLKPGELPPKIAKAAEGRPAYGGAVRDPGFWGDEPGIRTQMRDRLPQIAKKMGVELAPGREESIHEAAMIVKRANAEDTMNKVNAGVLTHENAAEKLLPNYLPRKMYDDPKTLGVVKSKLLSSKDPTRMREVTRGMNFEEAQAAMKEAGNKGFIEDPVSAAAANVLRSRKLLQDSNYLESAKGYGVRLAPNQARESGLVAIDHPELSDKQIIIKNEDGSIQHATLRQMFFPKQLASKVQYRVAPPPLTDLKGVWSKYNSMFRNMIFLSSPGLRFGNSMDNVLKSTAVMERPIQGFQDAYEVMSGKSAGFRTAPTALRPQGMFYDGAALKSLLDQNGVTAMNAMREGMEPFLEAGKKAMLDGRSKNPLDLAKEFLGHAATFGEGGEKLARAALFLDRVRSGWEPEMAANEVTRYLFDYARNSPVMDNVRFAMPFMQHPLKTAMIAPKLLGTAPGTYNFIQNTFPHVLANAFHDPVTRAEINTILPDSIKQRDGIAGPFIPGNTWMAAIFGSKNPKMGSAAWFDPRIGMRILNHFDYFSKGGSQRGFNELSPVLQGLAGFASGEDFGVETDKPWRLLDYANGATNVANRASYLISKIIGGVTPFPNAEKLAMQAFGLQDPKHVEPASVLIMKGLAGQFGGITDLDRDVQGKLLGTHHAYMDQKKQFLQAVRKEVGANANAGTLSKYVKSTYGSITGTSPIDLYKQMTASSQEGQEAALGAQALGGGMRAGDFATRMKGLSDEMGRLNQAYQTLGARYLQMSGKH